MRRSAVFAAGIAGGLLISWVLPHREPLTRGVNPVAGVEGAESKADSLLTAIPQETVELPVRTRAAPAAQVTPGTPSHLSAQEVARRALAWSASVRGDGVYGAGIVVDRRGHVLTNYHVVQGVERLKVAFADSIEEMPAEVVDFDKDLDLALLKVDAVRAVAAPPAVFLETQVGDDVFAVGCPRKMNFSVSRGMVSFLGRKIDGRYYLQSDLPTNDGNSGGPVVNDRGEVVAVMTFILRDSQGLAFAIPIDYAYERFAGVMHDPRIDLARFKRWRDERDAATASR